MITIDDTTTEQFVLVGAEVGYAVEQFMYSEARLLDHRKWEDWLALFTDDVHYWMPTRYNRLARESDLEVGGRADMALFDEGLAVLQQRVARLRTGMAWSEDPPSRTRHLVTNVSAWEIGDGSLRVSSNFLVYRTRGSSTEEDIWAGERNDVLRRHASSFVIAERRILLDQSTVLAKNLSVLF